MGAQIGMELNESLSEKQLCNALLLSRWTLARAERSHVNVAGAA